MATYNSNDVTIVLDGVYLTGKADGTFVTTEKTEDNFTTTTTADGITVVSESNDKRGTITVTLDQTSPSLPYVSSLANSIDEFPAWVYGPNGEQAGGTRARIQKQASKSFGKETETREFVVEVFDYESE